MTFTQMLGNNGENRLRYSFCVSLIVFCLSMGCGQRIVSDAEIRAVAVQRSVVFGDVRPFSQCHASTIARLPTGEFLVALFGGTAEKDDDVGIWISKGDGARWSGPEQIVKIRDDPHWNPVLAYSPSGELFLFFKVGKTIPKWETWAMISDDHGITWSEAYELVKGDKGGRGPVRNKPIILSDGTWLAGASHEEGRWDVFVDRSADGGREWTRSEYVVVDHGECDGEGIIQPTLWESTPGTVHMLIRSSCGAIYRSDSEDFGLTWVPAYRTELPNPNSGIDLVKLEDSTLVLLYNPDDQNWGSRGTLMLAFSKDNGHTWTDALEIENGTDESEFSYPAIIHWENNIALTYTWQRENIAFVEVKLD